MNDEMSVFWFRRDLRLKDNAGLFHALKGKLPVIPIFIFDETILNQLTDKSDKRVQFIYHEICLLKEELQSLSSDLTVYYGNPLVVWKELLKKYTVKKVYFNHDYEPGAINRDMLLGSILNQQNIELMSFKDQCIFEKEEIVKEDGKPYTVFTPYSKKWKSQLSSLHLSSYPTEKYFNNFHKTNPEKLLSLTSIGFNNTKVDFPAKKTDDEIINSYENQRNFPSLLGTTHLGIHFRFGTISIREMARKALASSETWLNELIWRDFYMQILYHFPYVEKKAFKPAYNLIKWRNNEAEFKLWCEGMTGYPIVDAGMRELNETGFMHNRVRMIVASFLTKHLLIDWRWGEAYFAQKLLDYDLSANNGGWQWAAGSGTDAAPYFRIFNPALQTEKFDKELVYIKKWVPELGSNTYPKPIVNHTLARKRCLEVYKTALNSY